MASLSISLELSGTCMYFPTKAAVVLSFVIPEISGFSGLALFKLLMLQR
jgi:hypothetical protein